MISVVKYQHFSYMCVLSVIQNSTRCMKYDYEIANKAIFQMFIEENDLKITELYT